MGEISGKKIAIWGLGDRAHVFMKFGFFHKHKIVACIDTAKRNEKFYDRDVYEPAWLLNNMEDIDYLVITTYHFSEIYNWCINMKIPREKIILTDLVKDPIFEQKLDVIEAEFPLLYEHMKNMQYGLMKMNETDIYDDKRLVGQGKYAKREYMSDYFRYRTFEFVAEEILKNRIEGEVAEFGVFRGVFSSLISEKLPEKKIFLFDTFEGFENAEADEEKRLGRSDCKFEYWHTLTSEERMIQNMPYPEKCVVCKGFFPDSITEQAKKSKYAFVSIDVDFEASIYEGLRFFYPRLAEGGYIFVHDYTNPQLTGVKEAVRRYEEAIGSVLKKVPLADWAGTLVILK